MKFLLVVSAVLQLPKFNIFIGRLGYSVFLIQNILDTIDTGKISVNICYDIACKLSSHLKVKSALSALPLCHAMVIIFHGY